MQLTNIIDAIIRLHTTKPHRKTPTSYPSPNHIKIQNYPPATAPFCYSLHSSKLQKKSSSTEYSTAPEPLKSYHLFNSASVPNTTLFNSSKNCDRHNHGIQQTAKTISQVANKQIQIRLNILQPYWQLWVIQNKLRKDRDLY